MKHRSLFWGIFLLAAGLFVITSQFGYFIHLGFWSIAVTILLVAALIGGLADFNFYGIFIPLALLYLTYERPLHLPVIPAWPLLLGAILLAAGCQIIFPGWHHRWHCHHSGHGEHGHSNQFRESFSATDENVDGDDIFVRSSFSQTSKYLHADSLKKAELISSFGSLRVYFDQVRLDSGGAEIDVDANCSEMALYLPKAWRVINHVKTSLGTIDDDTQNSRPEADAPTLTFNGRVSFGTLQIHHI